MIWKCWSSSLVLLFLEIFYSGIAIFYTSKQSCIIKYNYCKQINTSAAMNCIYALAWFCSDTNDILNNFSCSVCTCFHYLLYKFKRHSKLHLNSHPIKNLLIFASVYQVKFYNFYTHLSLETEFPALKLTQICWINMKITFLENWQF